MKKEKKQLDPKDWGYYDKLSNQLSPASKIEYLCMLEMLQTSHRKWLY